VFDLGAVTRRALPFNLCRGAAPEDEFASRLKELFSLFPVEIIKENG
jgi:hypothetical protein